MYVFLSACKSYTDVHFPGRDKSPARENRWCCSCGRGKVRCNCTCYKRNENYRSTAVCAVANIVVKIFVSCVFRNFLETARRPGSLRYRASTHLYANAC